MSAILALADYHMRWRQGRASSASRPVIDPGQFGVELIGDRPARDFVLRHHYAGSYPAALAAFGLFRRSGAHQTELAGVCVFSVPMQPGAAAAYGATGVPFCDLGRFVLLDDVEQNGETWLLRRALAGLGQVKTGSDGRPAHQIVLAYSDPVPRTTIDAKTVHQGHAGLINQASSNGLYLGRATPRHHIIAHDATLISPRAISKIRSGEKGAARAYERLVAAGAPAIGRGEPIDAWLARAMACGAFRRFKHAGNHVYAFPTGTHAQRRTARQTLRINPLRPRFTDPVPDYF